MNVVIMSPHFPPNHVNYSLRLRNRGVNVLGIGDAPYESLAWELRTALSDYVYVPDMTDYDAMLRAMGHLTSRHGKIDRIDSQNEFWLEIEARLREDFNIYGQKTADTDINRSKLGMKTVCKTHAIPCAPAAAVTSLGQVSAFAKEVGYPVILKPEVGVGASATHRVDNEEELVRLVETLPAGYLCEPFVRGEIVTFDGLVDRDGRLVFVTSHEYSGGVMEVVNAGASLYYYSVRELDPALMKIGLATVAAFGIKERFFHIEFFRRPDDYWLLEVNIRPPGLYTIDMMNFSADVDLYDMWAALLTGQRLPDPPPRKYFVGFVGRRRTVPHIHSHEEIMARYSDRTVMSQPIPGSYANAMGHHCYLLRHAEQQALSEAINFIMA